MRPWRGVMNLDDLAKRIRAAREKRHLKQTDLASALQVSPQAVSKWERGENAPDIALLVPLARLLAVSVDALLGAYAEDRDVFEATVLAAGAQDAREKSETLSPRDFAAWANGVCAQMTEAVLAHGGVPVKYMGPGILAFFSGTDHARRAAEALLGAKRVAAAPIKGAAAEGLIYFGPIGHPDYAQPDVMGEPVTIALAAMDWAAANTKSGLVTAVAAKGGGAVGDRRLGTRRRVKFDRVIHEAVLREIRV